MSRPMFMNPFARGAVKTGERDVDGGAGLRPAHTRRVEHVDPCSTSGQSQGSCGGSQRGDSAVVLLSPPARPVDSRRQGRVYDETVNIYAQPPSQSAEPQRTRKASFLIRKGSKMLQSPTPIIKKVADLLRPKESSAEARRDVLRSQLALNPPPKSLADFPPHPIEPSRRPRPTCPPRPPPIDLDVLECMRQYPTVEELERAVDRERRVNVVAGPRTPVSVQAEIHPEQPDDLPGIPPKAKRTLGSGLQAIPAKRRKIGVTPSLYRNIAKATSPRESYWDVLQVNRKRVPPPSEAKWITGGVLGQGGFGTVLLVYDVARGAQCALKVVHYSRGMSKPSCRGVVNELKALAKIAEDADPSPFLLRPYVYGAHWAWRSSAGYLHILTEFCSGGDLSCYEYRLSEHALALVCAEVILGLNHLHKLGIVHHDLKPQNILVTSEGHCVISDFGGAQFLDRDKLITREPHGANAVMTVPFAAPELLCDEDSETTHTQAVDYWSLGTTLVSLLMDDAYLPGTDPETPLGLKLGGIQQRLQDHGTSIELRAFIKALLQPDASMRPMFPAITQLPFLQAVDWKAVQEQRCPPIRMVRELGALAHGYSVPTARVHKTRHPADFLEMLRHERLSLTVDDSYDAEAHLAAVTYEL